MLFPGIHLPGETNNAAGGDTGRSGNRKAALFRADRCRFCVPCTPVFSASQADVIAAEIPKKDLADVFFFFV